MGRDYHFITEFQGQTIIQWDGNTNSLNDIENNSIIHIGKTYLFEVWSMDSEENNLTIPQLVKGLTDTFSKIQ